MAVFKRRFRREGVPELNTTSTADISFMLLILFLVTTSMDSNFGLLRLLPKADDKQEETVQKDVDRRNVFTINITADDQIMHEDTELKDAEIIPLLKEFVMNPKGKSELSESPEKHIIMITCDEASHYDTYFRLENNIVRMYKQLREEESERRFGREFSQLTDRQKQTIRETIPQRISEE